jgi:hypothetical protein
MVLCILTYRSIGKKHTSYQRHLPGEPIGTIAYAAMRQIAHGEIFAIIYNKNEH